MSKGQVSAIIVAVIIAATGIWLTLKSDTPAKPTLSNDRTNKRVSEENSSTDESNDGKEFTLEEIVSEIISLADNQTNG